MTDNIKDDALKSCPFCGGEAEITTHCYDNTKYPFMVKCYGCRVESGLERTKQQAAEAWNIRTPDIAKMVDDMRVAREALQGLYDDNMDYITKNHLGGENNHWIKGAREALSSLKPYEKLFAKNGIKMSENQTPSRDLLDLERMGWEREPDGWIFPTALTPQYFSYEDAVEFNQHLMDWMGKRELYKEQPHD